MTSIDCFRYREKAPSAHPNWIEFPVNPPDARFSKIFNLQANTLYEFQVIGTNEFGDGMFSEIVQASTKGKTQSTESEKLAKKLTYDF